MRFRFVAMLLLALCTANGPAHAASCEKQVKRLYDGGALDPFERGPREEVATIIAPDGSETPAQTVRWETPTQVITFMNGMYLLQYGRDMYAGPSWDGPWTHQQEMNFDPEEQARNVSKTYTDAMENAECGKTELDGVPVKTYAFHYKAGSEQGGSWWEGDLVLFVSKDGLVRMEERNSAASWAPEPKDSVMVTKVALMPDFSITPPAK